MLVYGVFLRTCRSGILGVSEPRVASLHRAKLRGANLSHSILRQATSGRGSSGAAVSRGCLGGANLTRGAVRGPDLVCGTAREWTALLEASPARSEVSRSDGHGSDLRSSTTNHPAAQPCPPRWNRAHPREPTSAASSKSLLDDRPRRHQRPSARGYVDRSTHPDAVIDVTRTIAAGHAPGDLSLPVFDFEN